MGARWASKARSVGERRALDAIGIIGVTAASVAFLGCNATVSHREFLAGTTRAVSDARALRASLKPMSASALSGPRCPGLRAYERADVAKAFDKLRSDLLASAGGRDNVALRDYIAWKLSSLPPQETAIVQCFPPGFTMISESATQTLWKRVDDLVAQLLSWPSLDITVGVTSTPDRAEFILKPESNRGREIHDTTNARLDPIRRGYYTLTVTMPHRKAVEPMPIDLVDQTPSGISCTLVPEASPDKSTCSRY